ncbi:hypothetical protein PsYK624_013960 [Phanerochaete sordida]|uniref:Uncharacterized protein n=1 Tax=Phanerochaete sordida TaxID=48140 RepID=A0A9P3L936_9APHY|nr:hypothetical protein PsYK624_013960 [Phanerochaete sordida]
MLFPHRARAHAATYTDVAAEDCSAEAHLPVPATAGYVRGPPRVTWYRTIVTVSVLGLGTWKTVASVQGAAIISNALDWIVGVALAVLYFWLGECEDAVSLRWLFRRSVVADVRDISQLSVEAFTSTRQIVSGRWQLLVAVYVGDRPQHEEQTIILKLDDESNTLDPHPSKPLSRLPTEILFAVALELVVDYVESALAGPALSARTWDNASHAKQNPIAALLMVSFEVREVTLKVTAQALAIDFVPDGLGRLTMRPWARIKEIQSLRYKEPGEGTRCENLTRFERSPLIHTYAAMYLAQRELQVAADLSAQLQRLPESLDCAHAFRSGQPDELEKAAECPLWRSFQNHINHAKALTSIARKASSQFLTLKLIPSVWTDDVIHILSAMATTAPSVSRLTPPEAVSGVLDHYILHVKGNVDYDGWLRRSLDALQDLMEEVRQCGLSTSASKRLLAKNTYERGRKSLQELTAFRLPSIMEYYFGDQYSQIVGIAQDLHAQHQPYSWGWERYEECSGDILTELFCA